MLYTPHFLTGAVILKFFPNPAAGVGLAFISHFVLDMMPHNDFDIRPGITLKEFLNTEKKRRNLIIAALVSDFFLAAVSFFWILFTFRNYWMIIGGIAGFSKFLIESNFIGVLISAIAFFGGIWLIGQSIE